MVNSVSRRNRLVPQRRRRVNIEERAEPMLAEMPQSAQRTWHGPEGLREIAKLLWLPCYAKLFAFEYEANRAECGDGFELQPTTYRARLKGEAAAIYDERRHHQQRDQMAIALHCNNQMRWSPSLLARSVSYFNSATAWMQAEEGR
jgi:hypothetical protein